MLSSDDKKLVKNYKVLTSAEERYQALVKKSEEVDYSIIDAHNASVDVVSRQDFGTRFTVTFPGSRIRTEEGKTS